MAQIKFYKLLALPADPEPDSVYFIKDGSKFDLYITDSSGNIAELDLPPGSGGMSELSDDTTPELGGDLILGIYNIIGQLENTDFILDGGLI